MKTWAILGWVAVAACTTRNPDYCEDSSECTDPATPFCDVAGDYGNANSCVPEPSGTDAGIPAFDAYAGPPTVSVESTGTGTGTVVSSPAGIDCGDSCSAEFERGSTVTLSASAGAGTSFVTWGGACPEGFDDCTVEVTGGHVVTAQFGLEGEHIWSRAIGGAGSDRGVDVAFDSAGNVIVTGIFSGATDFGDGNTVTPSGSEAFVAKYTEDMAFEWVQRVVAAPKGVVVDTLGDVYFVGDSATGMTLAKLRGTDGGVVWTEEVTGDLTAGGLAVGGGRLVVVGGFEGTVDFGAGDLGAVLSDVFVAWYTPDGDLLRAFDFGSSEEDLAIAVDVDEAGRAVVGGIIGSPTSFGGGTLPVTGAYSAFVVELSASGTHLWSKSMPSDSGASFASTVSYGDGGDVFTAGLFTGAVDFGDGPVDAGSVSAMFIARYAASDGAHLWAVAPKALGEYCTMIVCLPSRLIPHEVLADARGRIIVGGEFIGSADFGAGVQSSFGGTDVFLAWYRASDGAHIRSPVYGRMEEPATAQFQISSGMLGVDRLGNVAVTGRLVGNLGFGGPVLEPDGIDAFLVKFGP